MHDHQLDATHCIFLGFAEGGSEVEGCCCPSPDGVVCVAIRYNQEVEDVDEPCECYCHFQAERRFGKLEDGFYFDAPDGFDDDGNRHNEMWNSPVQPALELLEFAKRREYSFPDTDSISRTEPWKRKESSHE
jgi:hypothetical protein